MKTTNMPSPRLPQRCAGAILYLFFIWVMPVFAEQVTSGISFAQVSFTGSNPAVMYSHYGQVSVDFAMLYGEGYINIERYENGKAAGWVVRNLPIVNASTLSGFSTLFDLGTDGYRSSFSGYVDYSATPLADDNSLINRAPINYALGQFENSLNVPAKQYDVFFEIKDCAKPTKIETLDKRYEQILTKGAADFCLLNALNEKDTDNIITQAAVRSDKPLTDLDPPTIAGTPFFDSFGYAGRLSVTIVFFKGGFTGIPRDNKTFILHIKDFTGAKTVSFGAIRVK